MQDGTPPIQFLIRDRDAQYPRAFDSVWTSNTGTIVRTPVPAPNAHAVAERWNRSVREEWLDTILIRNERHLQRVLTA